jgi:hypothetical protein
VLPGTSDKLKWSQDDVGLKIEIPIEKTGDYAHVFRITCSGDVLGVLR